MKYADGFRALYKQCNALMLKEEDQLLQTLEAFPQLPGANCLLVYGYIDHEQGLTFEVLAMGCKDGDDFTFATGCADTRVIIRAFNLPDHDFYPVDAPYEEEHAAKIELLKHYDPSPEIEDTRAMEFLDECREPGYVDDVLVYFIRDELAVEACWVRIEQMRSPHLVGTLLNEPNQDFGCHKDDLVTFSVRRMGDGKVVCIAELGMAGQT